MQQFAFTGARQLSKKQELRIYRELLPEIRAILAEWHVGDADGLDSFIRRAARYYCIPHTVHEVTHRQRWGFAERSQRMVKAIAGGILYGFPNKPCPADCTPSQPFSGHGSGTWGTIAYARKLGLEVRLFPLVAIADLPEWLTEAKQLALFS